VQKKASIIVCIIFSIISIVGVIFFNYLPENRVPSNGFHVIEHKAYYVFTDKEDKTIDLDIFFVNNDINNNNTLIKKYTELCLVSKEGAEYPFSLSNNEIDYYMETQKNNKYQSKIIEQTIKVNLSEFSDLLDTVEFNKLKYKNERGQVVTKDLGSIRVDVIVGSNDVVALSSRLSWTHFEQPTITEVNYCFENGSNNKIEINNIDYGSIGVRVEIPSSINLDSSEYKECMYDVKLDGEKVGEPVVYMMKPQFSYSMDGNKKTGLFANVSTEKYLDPELDLNEYLYIREKKEAKEIIG
jgi:hypothetical protein